MADKKVKAKTKKDDDKITQMNFRARESYKALRTNIQFLLVGDKKRLIVFTSSCAGEGKSTTAVNTAVAMAETGSRVLIIDADFRRPVIHKMLEITVMPGMTNYLSGLASPDEIIRHSRYPGLDVATAGAIPPNSAELLGCEAMKLFLEQVSNKYDIVIIDTPPVTVVSDALVISSLVSGYVVIVRQNQTEMADFKSAINKLELVEAKILGIVMNDVTNDSLGYGYAKKDKYGYYA